MAEESSNLFDAVRKANRLAWEQASGRKPYGDKREIPAATGLESNLEGYDNSSLIAALNAKLSALQARVDFIEDDFPEQEAHGDAGTSNFPYSFSLSVSSVSGSRITCTGGDWYHRTTTYGFAEKEFWFGSEDEKPDGAIWLPTGTVYVYVELPSMLWAYTTSDDDLKSSTTYLRRPIFSCVISEDRKLNSLIVKNAGDIHS